MKSFAIIFLTLIIAETISAQLFPQQPMKCGENEVFIQCSNRANRCEPSCDVPVPTVCTLMCGQGCDCKPGFLRSKDGKCVLPTQC
uniref:TIL domain-containing protein n=1 Tax=Panagrolaimus sp. PS1159 TaxID=55785 RepID=A0AC35G0B3_9BILA